MGQYESYPNQELPGIEAAAAWLDEHRPTDWTPAIMHGDYHMGNVLVAPDPPAAVAAVCDWETASIGDPLLDLAAFVRFWTRGSPCHRRLAGPRPRSSSGTRRGRAARSPISRTTPCSARFRLAVMMEGIYQRSFADPTREVANDMHVYSSFLVADLQSLITDP